MKGKTTFFLPWEAEDGEVTNTPLRKAYKADLQFIEDFKFNNLNPDDISEIVTLIKSKVRRERT